MYDFVVANNFQGRKKIELPQPDSKYLRKTYS